MPTKYLSLHHPHTAVGGHIIKEHWTAIQWI